MQRRARRARVLPRTAGPPALLCPRASLGDGAPATLALTAMHCRMMQLCFIRPGPPNFFMSLQKWHSPHSVRRQASHLRHRVRRRRAPAVVRLAANFTAEAGPSFPLGRPTARFCGRAHRTVRWATGPARPPRQGVWSQPQNLRRRSLFRNRAFTEVIQLK